MIEKNFAAGELKEAAVQWQAQKGWRKVRQRCERLGWWCLLDEIITDLRRGG
ncbi:MAG: hypothetical protein PHH13_04140 [Candidatus Peribacteraceae bacterium]|nr:hypothetical protein [Candidatus Peribacteraceae bacterium]